MSAPDLLAPGFAREWFFTLCPDATQDQFKRWCERRVIDAEFGFHSDDAMFLEQVARDCRAQGRPARAASLERIAAVIAAGTDE